jgi:hypothetical protein
MKPEHGANIETKDNNGFTPLYVAAKRHHNYELTKFLLSKGANPNASDKEGKILFKQVLKYLGIFHDKTILKLLIAHQVHLFSYLIHTKEVEEQLTILARRDSTCLDYLIPAGIGISLNRSDLRDEAIRKSIAMRKDDLERQIREVFNIDQEELNTPGKSTEILFLLSRIYWLKSCRLKNSKAKIEARQQASQTEASQKESIREENIRFFRSLQDKPKSSTIATSQSNKQGEKLYELINQLPNELIDLIRNFLNNYIDEVLLLGKKAGKKEYFWVGWVLEAFQNDFDRCKKFTAERFTRSSSELVLASPSASS